MPYFSTSLNPGVVLRVPARTPVYPAPRTSDTTRCDWVAMPEQRASVLRATRSPSRMPRTGPVTVATLILPSGEDDGSRDAPSAWVPLDAAARLGEYLGEEGDAGEDAGRLGEERCAPGRLSDDEARVVEGGGVFGQPGGYLGFIGRREKVCFVVGGHDGEGDGGNGAANLAERMS
ncbi:hypothetical protein J3459_020909 [Metarhizium acridum]|nr:hypothetical protein J3459_020909 [Metarhizium acridum]